ncbi:MAG: DUF2071 domain-containing protein [Pyrinomonadaceae bacterium]
MPAGTLLDLQEGRCFVSFVGFMFLDTRVLRFSVPMHTNFQEVNLRFYVKRENNGETRHGVVFIKEIVPRFAISAVARIFYGKPYEAWRMGNVRDGRNVKYTWSNNANSNSLSVEIGNSLGGPEENSHGEFIIEH